LLGRLYEFDKGGVEFVDDDESHLTEDACPLVGLGYFNALEDLLYEFCFSEIHELLKGDALFDCLLDVRGELFILEVNEWPEAEVA